MTLYDDVSDEALTAWLDERIAEQAEYDREDIERDAALDRED